MLHLFLLAFLTAAPQWRTAEVVDQIGRSAVPSPQSSVGNDHGLRTEDFGQRTPRHCPCADAQGRADRPSGTELMRGGAQEKLDPSKHPWAKWKTGAWAKYNLVRQVADDRTTGTMTTTLTKVTGEGYTTNAKYMFGGETFDEEKFETIPVKDGEETLTVEGKKYECAIWKSTSKKGEKKTEYRVWATKSGDRPLKLVGQGDARLEVAAIKLSESVEVSGKKYDCIRLEGKVTRPGHDGKLTWWMAEGIPGGLVKGEEEFSGDLELTGTLELAEFKAEK